MGGVISMRKQKGTLKKGRDSEKDDDDDDVYKRSWETHAYASSMLKVTGWVWCYQMLKTGSTDVHPIEVALVTQKLYRA